MAKRVEQSRTSKKQLPPPPLKGQARTKRQLETPTEKPAERKSAAAAQPPQAAGEAASAPRWGQLEPASRQVLELFERQAAELRFPGISFESLLAHAEQLEQLAQTVADAEQQLQAAHSARAAAATEFAEATKRAFAYALVYAQEHLELQGELQAFAYAKPEKPRRKAREAGAGGAHKRADLASESVKHTAPGERAARVAGAES